MKYIFPHVTSASWILICGLYFHIFAPSADANIIDNIRLGQPPKVAVTLVDDQPGIRKYLVASNTPYAIFIDGLIGEVNINIDDRGTLNGDRFGDSVTPTTRINTCRILYSFQNNLVYRGSKKTASRPGSILDQSVLVTLNFDEITSPAISIKPFDSLTGSKRVLNSDC